MRTKIICTFVLLFSVLSIAQTKVTWFPSNLNIQPFTANFLEPKAGASYLFNMDKIRLDIGTSADIVHIKNDNSTLSFGADLFTFTRIRSEKNFRFPVENIDFLFGINAGYKVVDKNTQYGFRFRFSHISAHLVDGRYDQQNNVWRDNYNPFVFSKEFFELTPFYQVNSLRGYLGLTYIIHSVPDGIGHGIYQAGFDYYLTSFNDIPFTPYIADDFKVSNINDKYFGNNIFTTGIKFGRYDAKGFSLYYSYISGKSVHGELYNISESYSSIGFNVDL